MKRLKKRAEFVAVAKGKRVERSGFVIQARRRASEAAEIPAEATAKTPPRFGFTVTKKIGNSVIRNRIRRRLREAARRAGPGHAGAGVDYVLMARQGALTLPFERLIADLGEGIERINQILAAPRRPAAGGVLGDGKNGQRATPKSGTAGTTDAE